MTHSVFSARSMAQLVSESVILWQRIVEGGSCFLPPPPSGAKLWRKTPHKTERRVLKKAPCFRRKEPRKNRDSSLSSENLVWSGQSPLRESLCLQNTHCWEARPDTWKAVSGISELYSEHSRKTELSELEFSLSFFSLRYASEIQQESVRKRISLVFTDGWFLTHLASCEQPAQPSF